MSTLLAEYLPAAHLENVETALLQTFATTAVTTITPLADGYSGVPVYKISIGAAVYVLKIDPAASAAAEIPDNLVLAAQAGVAPPLFYRNKTNGISISGFITQQPLRKVFPADELTPKLAGIIKSIHAIPAPAGSNSLRAAIDSLIARFRQQPILSGPVIDECFAQYETISKYYPWQDTDLVFSHNDLNPNNILCDGERIWVIDWDKAFLNDRYVDLSNTANFFVHSAAQEQAFLTTYFNAAPTEYQLARFFIMRQVCRIIYSMLMFGLAAQAKPAGYEHNQEMEGVTLAAFMELMGSGAISLGSYEGAFMYGKALMNEAVQQMRSPRFQSALQQLQ